MTLKNITYQVIEICGDRSRSPTLATASVTLRRGNDLLKDRALCRFEQLPRPRDVQSSALRLKTTSL